MNQYANDFTDIVKLYYDDLKKCKPLSKTKERRLLRLSKRGDIKAKNQILESNLRFVFDVAKRYTGRGVPIGDLISEGNMGLIRAIDKFDENVDVKFISYAVWWIRQAMLEAIRKSKINQTSEIIKIDADDNNIEKIMSDSEDEKVTSIEVMYSDGNEKQENNEINEEQKRMIVKLLSILTEREKDIIERYYGVNGKEEMTLIEIGEELNLTSERVRQIKVSSMRKLRTMILEKNLSLKSF